VHAKSLVARYRNQLRTYETRSPGHPTRGGPPPCGLSRGLQPVTANYTEMVYSLVYSCVPQVFFPPHHTYVTVTLRSKATLAKTRVPNVTLGRCYTVSTKMVETNGCPGLVAKAGKKFSVGQSTLSTCHSVFRTT
jgi:hypothetical protein